MKHIVVTGSLAFDYILDFPGSFEEHILPHKIKALSVSFLVDKVNKNFGGVSGNIAYNLALFGQKSTILASAGSKDFEEYQAHLETCGVDTSQIHKVNDEFSATAYIMTDKNNCQITGFYEGAMRSDSDLSLPGGSSFIVIAPTHPKAMAKFVKEAKKRNIPYLFDPAQQIPALERQTLQEGVDGAEIIIGNDYEIALILKRTGYSKKDLLAKAAIVIITLGKRGSLIEIKDQHIPIGIAKPKVVIDPTGAGDAYIAGFIAGYRRQLSLQKCGQLGATAAVYAVEQYGTQNHSFRIDAFKKRYSQAFGEMIEL